MRHEDSGADLVEQRRNGIGREIGVEGARVGNHLAKILVQGFRVMRELHPRKEVRPGAQAELVEPPLLVRRGTDCRSHGTSTRAASARLIQQVYGESAPQKDVLVALASIRGGFPGL